ncbi:kinase-like domain-containing protein [Mycena belliarum]|uniref:Kinase-like domain-containing protein n=1 Tax=Mycena belliarum TaxID=1033014 RepID=A0AAD6TY35_9AGAR|nr:kinase-like domain-containing protein [Mycena belliae]
MDTTTWTLEQVKDRISKGQEIDERVVDIGQNTVVKFADNVSAEEGEATMFIARMTSVPVARIYAILRDESDGVTYIVQEKLRGEPLINHLPTLDTATRDALALELQKILNELATLDKGHMGLFGRPSQYGSGILAKFDPPVPPIESPEDFLRWLPHNVRDNYGRDEAPLPTGIFDFSRPPIFSHGDFVPENILIEDGHVTGIIDWAYAGWYPYFWNDYIARRRSTLMAFQDGKWSQMVGQMMQPFPEEFRAFQQLYYRADSLL